MPHTQAARTSAALLALLTWAALSLQLYLSLSAHLPNVAVNFLSFFTVLSNLLVAAVLTATALTRTSTPPSPSFQTATAVYIAVVGLGYSLLLRHLVDLNGPHQLADSLLHDVIPVLYILLWLAFVRPRAPLPWSAAQIWLLWPAIYLTYTLVRGSRTGWYPYPFLNADTLGYPRVFAMVAALFLAFFGLGLAAVALTRRASPQTPLTPPARASVGR